MNIIIKYLYFLIFIFLLNSIQVSKEEDLLQLIDSKSESKTKEKINNILIQKDNILSEFKQAEVNNNYDNSIWNTYNINNNDGIIISFKPFNDINTQKHQKFEIILASNKDYNSFIQKKNLIFNNDNNITFVFDFVKTPLKENEINMELSIKKVSKVKMTKCQKKINIFQITFLL